MKKIIIITLLLISGLYVTAAGSYDYDFISNGVYYRINDDNASVVVVRSHDYASLTDIVIPDTVEYDGAKLRVTQVRPFAFYDCKQLKSVVINAEKILHQSFEGVESLTKVVIGKGARILDENVFRGCSNLTDLEIEPGLHEIRDGAFGDCTSLQNLEIPSSVVTILGAPFSLCSGLVTIKVDESNPKYDSRGNCNALIETTTNRLMLGSKSTVIPDEIEIIGPWAFSGSSFETVHLPSNLKAIENYAFSKSNLREISFPASLRTIYPWAFYDCSGLTKVILPNGIEKVCDYAFSNCANLQSITFPGTLKEIRNNAVASCRNLRHVEFKDGGNDLVVGERLFHVSESLPSSAYDQSLQWVSLPNSTKIIGRSALLLYGTSGNPSSKLMKTFRVPDSVDSLGSTSLAENVYISESSRLRSIGENNDYGSVKSFTLGLNLPPFSGSADFYANWYADNITLLPSVNNIEDARLLPYSHIYCYSEIPPVCNENTFAKSYKPNSIIVHVPEGAVDAYKSASRWSFFYNIVGDAVMPKSLRFDKQVIHMKPGEYIIPQVSLLPENANGGNLVLVSADASIAYVYDESNENRVKALKKGRTTLHCTYGALHATCEIIVDDEDYNEPCDINGDGKVDVGDINLCINVMLGKGTDATADVNGDGRVDIEDVNQVINAMLGK